MKNRKPIKLSALLTAVLLLAAVIVPGAAFAEELPAKNENKNTVNTVSIESNNEIYSPENPVTEVEVGSEFTLSMPKNIPSIHEEGCFPATMCIFTPGGFRANMMWFREALTNSAIPLTERS